MRCEEAYKHVEHYILWNNSPRLAIIPCFCRDGGSSSWSSKTDLDWLGSQVSTALCCLWAVTSTLHSGTQFDVGVCVLQRSYNFALSTITSSAGSWGDLRLVRFVAEAAVSASSHGCPFFTHLLHGLAKEGVRQESNKMWSISLVSQDLCPSLQETQAVDTLLWGIEDIMMASADRVCCPCYRILRKPPSSTTASQPYVRQLAPQPNKNFVKLQGICQFLASDDASSVILQPFFLMYIWHLTPMSEWHILSPRNTSYFWCERR